MLEPKFGFSKFRSSDLSESRKFGVPEFQSFGDHRKTPSPKELFIPRPRAESCRKINNENVQYIHIYIYIRERERERERERSKHRLRIDAQANRAGRIVRSYSRIQNGYQHPFDKAIFQARVLQSVRSIPLCEAK